MRIKAHRVSEDNQAGYWKDDVFVEGTGVCYWHMDGGQAQDDVFFPVKEGTILGYFETEEEAQAKLNA